MKNLYWIIILSMSCAVFTACGGNDEGDLHSPGESRKLESKKSIFEEIIKKSTFYRSKENATPPLHMKVMNKTFPYDPLLVSVIGSLASRTSSFKKDHVRSERMLSHL